MTFDQAVNHFGSQANMARAMLVGRSSVFEWKDGIPIGRQFQIQVLTGGKLKADILHCKKVAA